MAILTSDKISFHTRNPTRKEGGNWMTIKQLIHHEKKLKLLKNIYYVPNNSALKYMKQNLKVLKREISMTWKTKKG